MWKFIGENGWLFDSQQRWTSSNYRSIRNVFRPFARPNQRILEIGCATYSCVHRIWEGLNPHYVGVDLTHGYLKWGKRHHTGSEGVCADAARLPFNKLPFDIVCIFSVLHHLNDETIRLLSGHLSENLPPTARILVSEPVFPDESMPSNCSNRLSRFLLENDRGRHIRKAEEYQAILGNKFETLTSMKFIYGPHHFCGFEMRVKNPLHP